MSPSIKYVCPPWYECPCLPGKLVSRSTMRRHRKEANCKRTELGRGPFKEGPQVDIQSGLITEYQFNRIDSLEEHDIDDESVDTSRHTAKRRRLNSHSNTATSTATPVGAPENNNHTSEFQSSDVQNSGDLAAPMSGESVVAGDQESIVHTVNQTNSIQPNVQGDDVAVPIAQGFMTDSEYPPSIVEDLIQSTVADEAAEYSSMNQFESDSSDELVDTSRIPGFITWLHSAKMWVDLFYDHSLPHTVMDRILKNINAPCKTWKTVEGNVVRSSGMANHIQNIPTCPGHFCYSAETPPEVEVCSVCGQERPDNAQSRFGKVCYIPVIPRIRKMVSDEDRCETLLRYWNEREVTPGIYRDYFDGNGFFDLCVEHGGMDALRYDIFIGISTDGFQAFRNRSGDVWPVVAVILNLAPSIRYDVKNVLPILFTEDENQPKDIQSFLKPLIEEVKRSHASNGVYMTFANGDRRRVRLHVVWVSADLAALMKVAGLNGHNAKFPCRFCLVQGFFSNHYYFPSKLRTEHGIQVRYNTAAPPERSPEGVEVVFDKLSSCTTRSERVQISKESGISNRSIIFDLPGIFPYRSFPIDVMHLFYNIQVQLLRIHFGDWFEDEFVLRKEDISELDNELVRFSEGISCQISPSTRPLSKYSQWKAADHKEFTLCYMMILFDGIIPRECMAGLGLFVELVDLCFRVSLSFENVNRVELLARKFVDFYEKYYMRYEESRVHLCKYVIHLLLHLGESIRTHGPPICSSQYWVEKYIGWIVERSNAKTNPGASISRSTRFSESYKIFYRIPMHTIISEYDQLVDEGGFELLGCRRHSIRDIGTGAVQIRRLVSDYLVRKFEGLDGNIARQAALRISTIELASSVKFISGSAVMKATVEGSRWNVRASCYIAAEMEHDETVIHVYYGKLRKILRFEFNSSDIHHLEERFKDKTFSVAVVARASDIRKGHQGQVYKSCSLNRAFGASTMEDLAVIQSLIGVVQHKAATTDSGDRNVCAVRAARRMEERVYFVDHFLRIDGLLENSAICHDGINRVLKGLR